MTFSSNEVAMCIAVEQLKGNSYKLHIIGIPIVGLANVFAGNQSVFKNC
jgi:hypothetical protein